MGKLGVKVSYKKSWLGKKKAAEEAYGNFNTSYQELPQFLLTIQQTNPGTIVEWKHTEGSGADAKVFHSVFWSFMPSIEGFKSCRPVITIDGTHMRGKYKEKLLIACGVDAVGHIFPLAFCMSDEES